jgi:hypothetical protein
MNQYKNLFILLFIMITMTIIVKLFKYLKK